MNGRRLYEEIGGVSERYLQQAASYRARRRTPAWRVVLIAAALILTVALVLGTLAMSLGIALIGWLLNGTPEPGPDVEPPALSELAQMEATLAEQQSGLQAMRADEIGYFEEYYTLIWSENGSDEYYSVRLSGEEMSHMLYLMQSDRTEFTKDSEQPGMQIWLCMRDGLVISPYLKNSAGNASCGEVFDYDPELELSDELAEFIVRCVLT